VQQRLRPGGGDRVVEPVQARQLAAEQHDGGTGPRARMRGGRPKPAVRARDQDDAPGKLPGGTHPLPAHGCVASRRMRASSPDSASSPITSLPPISSPCRNSCGKVGQLEKRGKLARTSASSSTLTTWICCAPAASSARIAFAEKPHIGYSAVPFMNSTTGWLSTRAWIRSRTGIACSCSWASGRQGRVTRDRYNG